MADIEINTEFGIIEVVLDADEDSSVSVRIKGQPEFYYCISSDGVATLAHKSDYTIAELRPAPGLLKGRLTDAPYGD